MDYAYLLPFCVTDLQTRLVEACIEKGSPTGAASLLNRDGANCRHDIRDIKDAITEGARIYTDLQNRGLELEYFDAGGGLGVDYDGSQG